MLAVSCRIGDNAFSMRWRGVMRGLPSWKLALAALVALAAPVSVSFSFCHSDEPSVGPREGGLAAHPSHAAAGRAVEQSSGEPSGPMREASIVEGLGPTTKPNVDPRPPLAPVAGLSPRVDLSGRRAPRLALVLPRYSAPLFTPAAFPNSPRSPPLPA